ncbi:hypothetical protein PMI08_02972 [Brevibacillus sp. CF112]|nr:hypothetical protein PMI08_02972 [Brevibacillus sp. CF112]
MLRRFFSYYRPYRGLFVLDFTCAIFVAVLELGFPLAVNMVVDQLLPSKDWELIVWACLGLLALYAINAGMNYVRRHGGFQCARRGQCRRHARRAGVCQREL